MANTHEIFAFQARYEENGTIIKSGCRFVNDSSIYLCLQGNTVTKLYAR